MPENARRIRGKYLRRGIQRQVFDALGIEMDFAVIVAREALEQFGKGALRAVAAVHKRRNDGEPQVSASRRAAATRSAEAEQR